MSDPMERGGPRAEAASEVSATARQLDNDSVPRTGDIRQDLCVAPVPLRPDCACGGVPLVQTRRTNVLYVEFAHEFHCDHGTFGGAA